MRPPSWTFFGPISDPQKQLAYVRKLHAAWPLNSYDKCVAHSAKLLKAIDPPDYLAEPIALAIWDILSDDDYYYIIEPSSLVEVYLKKLAARFGDTKLLEAATDYLRMYFENIVDRLPKGEGGSFTVPAYDLFPAFQQQLHGTVGYFNEIEVFPHLKETLRNNLIVASGFDPQTYDGKKLKYPKDVTLPHAEAIDAYLQNSPLHQFWQTQAPFHIPQKTWASHGIILAPPNHGKTQLLGSLIAGFLTENDTPGIFVLDPHGDLFRTLSERVDPRNLVCLDPDTNPPPLNFLDFGTSTEAQTLQTFSYLMSSLSGGLSDKQGAIVPYLLKLLRSIPGASLETLRLCVDEKVKNAAASRYFPFISQLPDVDQGFFHNQFYSSRMQETKDAIGWKLYAALSSDAFRQMFSSTTNSFDADAAIRDRKVVVVKGGRNALGDTGMEVFLQFILAQYFAAGLRRDRIPQDQRHLTILFADECQKLMGSGKILSDILVELRKFACGFVGATQTFFQIADDVRAAVLGATAIKIVGPVSFSDSSLLSREMHTTPDFIRNLQAYERSHAEWAFSVAGLTRGGAVKVTVPYGQLEKMPTLKRPHKEAAPLDRNEVLPVTTIVPQTEEAAVVPAASEKIRPASGSEASATSLPQDDDNIGSTKKW